jgi:tRNA-2-methylthio-N6-dimethylallyladenosine synthase
VLPDHTTDLIKKHRLGILQDVIASNALRFNNKMLGSVYSVLVDGVSRKSETQMAGRTENNRVVNFTGSEDLIGQFVDVKIIEVRTNSLQGELVGLSEVKLSHLNKMNPTVNDTNNESCELG